MPQGDYLTWKFSGYTLIAVQHSTTHLNNLCSMRPAIWSGSQIIPLEKESRVAILISPLDSMMRQAQLLSTSLMRDGHQHCKESVLDYTATFALIHWNRLRQK